MSYTTTIEKEFIKTAIMWDKETFVVRQNYFTSMWVQKGYIEIKIDIPMSEYSFVEVSLTDLGKAILYAELL